MATAKEIKGESPWDLIEITDDLGGHWRYGRGAHAQKATAAHVKVQGGQSTLVKDNSGRPLLHLDDEGLPEKIVVRFDPSGDFEYDLVG
jgi:hypothetical protein